jgi:argininosuccinate lyase
MANDNSMLWGGRFNAGPSGDMIALTASIDVDMALLECDARTTKAHARVLVAAGLLDEGDLGPIDTTLNALVDEWRAGKLVPGPHDEDVHSLVERELTARLGEPGARIHAGRSRNDLVAQDLRLWCRDACERLEIAIADVVATLVDRAEEHESTVMPGTTHLQPAQPVSLGFHLLAHAFALMRDRARLQRAGAAAAASVLGAGALAGNTLGLDATIAARELGCDETFDNAMDAVSDRDFACDLLYACSLTGIHLSRLAEELILWTSPLYGFARLPDAWSTGSSMMPNKANPDMAELIRGRSAVTVGELASLLGLLKGLPLAYDRDLQEDKALVFGAVDRTLGALAGMRGLMTGVRFDRERLAGAVADAPVWATDVAELLVQRGLPFRAAHEIAGRLVARAEVAGGLTPELLDEHHELLSAGDLQRLEPATCMEARDSLGATSSARVREQMEQLRASLRPPA